MMILRFSAVLPCLFTSALAVALAAPDVLGRRVLDEPVKGGTSVDITSGENITAAYFVGDPERKPIIVEFNGGASKVTLEVLAGDGGKVVLEMAESTTQFADGRIVLSALDANVVGKTAARETHSGNHHIGSWSDIDDVVEWSYAATRPGMYDAEITYSLAGAGSNKIELSLGGEKLTGSLHPTGSWSRYSRISLGRFYLKKAGQLSVRARGLELNGGAVMNLKAVTLRPAPEGKAVVQAADGSVELDAGAATVHSTLMQYERPLQKLCLGYWVNPKDWASFTFPIAKPGKFRVELTQGCGKGHGGSEVDVIIGGETLKFIVEDTGGFQNWKVLELGEVNFESAGEYELEIRPRKRKGGAVMDVRRVRLVPL